MRILAIPDSLYNKLKGSKVSMTVDKTMDTDSQLHVKLNKSHIGKKAVLYCYDGNKLVKFGEACKVDKNGYASFGVEQGGQYVIVIK